MNGKMCSDCKHRSRYAGVGAEYNDCLHPNAGETHYIWFMDESDCPGKEVKK